MPILEQPAGYLPVCHTQRKRHAGLIRGVPAEKTSLELREHRGIEAQPELLGALAHIAEVQLLRFTDRLGPLAVGQVDCSPSLVFTNHAVRLETWFQNVKRR